MTTALDELIERLRAIASYRELCVGEAADTLERLRDALAEIRGFAVTRTKEAAGFGLIVRAADEALSTHETGHE